MMQLGMDGVFVGSGIFKSEDPTKRAKAIVRAVAHYSDPKVLLETSTNLGKAMVGISDVKGDAVNFRDREGGAKEATDDRGHQEEACKLHRPLRRPRSSKPPRSTTAESSWMAE